MSQAAHNLGLVSKEEGDAACERGDEASARRHFEEAIPFLEESLRLKQGYDDKLGEAGSRNLLAQIYLRLADLTAAECQAQKSRQIREALGLKEAWRDYNTLSEIAQARGDDAAAAEWAQKRDDLSAELRRRAGGGVS